MWLRRGTIVWTLGLVLACLQCSSGDRVCPDYLGRVRADVETCNAEGEWYLLGVHEVGGRVRSLMWRDYGSGEVESNVVNWIPDDYWKRDVAELEHESDSLEASPGDQVVSFLRLHCKWDRSLLDGNRLIMTELREEGVAPDLVRNCNPWPAAIEIEAHRPITGECYENVFCPMGTRCVPGTVAATCPDEGLICAEPWYSALDIDTDGEPNCEDDDVDGDGLSNEEESSGSVSGFATDAWVADTDGDGVNDGEDPYPTQACPGGPLFLDLFSEGTTELQTITEDWSLGGGFFHAADGEAANQLAWIGPQTWDSYVVETRVRHDRSGPVGLLFHVQGETGEGYYAGVQAFYGDAVIGTVGADGKLARLSENYDVQDIGGSNAWNVLTLSVQEGTFVLYVNGRQAVSLSDTTFAAGSVGLFAQLTETDFDYLLVCPQ